MNTRTRQNELVRILRRRGLTSVAYLCDSLGVSRRTILRDITNLKDEGFIIHTTAGPGGGISLDPTSILVTPKLTSSEVFALLISVAVLKETHSIPFADMANAGLRKIEQALPKERVRELRKILTCVYVGPSATEDILSTLKPIDTSVLGIFETCFLQSQRMQFRYTDRRGNRTAREADPHAMLVLSPVWYLVGFDPAKDAFRHFRMDRIRNAKVLDNAFSRRTFTIDEGECPFSMFVK